jgi:hypothetical protein
MIVVGCVSVLSVSLPQKSDLSRGVACCAGGAVQQAVCARLEGVLLRT